ncbi:hypothetical protein [Thalassotalea aquiviva]|uniref:hypothetical protein n=1 Tax=Thalassotalea aquiviva TaxID=3242415 RepID=UPI00352A1D0B
MMTFWSHFLWAKFIGFGDTLIRLIESNGAGKRQKNSGDSSPLFKSISLEQLEVVACA